MAKFHFCFTDGSAIEDADAERCQTLKEACHHASKVAHELAAGRPTSELIGWDISVLDESGREVAVVPLSWQS